MSEWVFTVSEVAEFLKRVIGSEELLQNLQVCGEVSGLRRAASGHIYFTVKDAACQLHCIYFAQDQRAASRASLKEGAQVTLSGRMGVYTAGGQLNLYVKDVRDNGVGNLYVMLEQRKERLRAQGYFDAAHKKTLPSYPHSIGVITSRQGAVIRDILRVALRRDPDLHIALYPVRVQGEGAAQEMIRALKAFNERYPVDLLILGRGGGSFEDLFEFQDEGLVKAIYHSRIPVVSAVGHEVDYTLADFAADVRAATPSEAAELAVPSRENTAQNVSMLQIRLDQALETRLRSAAGAYEQLEARLARCHPSQRLAQGLQRLEHAQQRLQTGAKAQLEKQNAQLSVLCQRLEALNPHSVLRRGYAMVYHEDRSLAADAASVAAEETLRIVLRDGNIHARALNKEIMHGEEDHD